MLTRMQKRGKMKPIRKKPIQHLRITLLLILTLLSQISFAIEKYTPTLVQPSDIVGDEIKITGVDNEPDATLEKIHAVGTWFDSSASEYIIFVLNIETDA